MRLNAIAVERAPTIATAIHRICEKLGSPRAASTAPSNANGNANNVCSILIISSVVRMLLRIPADILSESVKWNSLQASRPILRLPSGNRKQRLFEVVVQFDVARASCACLHGRDAGATSSNCTTTLIQIWNGFPFSRVRKRDARIGPDNMTIIRKTGQKRPARASSKRATRGTGFTAFARSLWQEWRRLGLPAANARVVVAVSGGADSVALLLSLNELIESKKLNVKLVVAHLDHALRKNSKDDARWVKAFAKQLGHESLTRRVDVKALAASSGDNLEQAARHARYKFLADVAKKKRAS